MPTRRPCRSAVSPNAHRNAGGSARSSSTSGYSGSRWTSNVIDFSLANVKLRGDGGDYRVRYGVDDDDMQWVDRWEQVVLTGWIAGKHTIRVELVGPDGWPYRNGDYNVVTREITITRE